MDDETEGLLPQSSVKRTISIQVFLGTIVCFVLILLGVGLGVGLGQHLVLSQLPSLDFDHSDVEALPSLDAVPAGELVNMTELDMRTRFTVSANTAVREYEFDITQMTAAPDGFYKPMILANGRSPGPLIEANMGDTIRVMFCRECLLASVMRADERKGPRQQPDGEHEHHHPLAWNRPAEHNMDGRRCRSVAVRDPAGPELHL